MPVVPLGLLGNQSAEPTPISDCGTTGPSVNCPSSYLDGSCSVPFDIATTVAETGGWHIGCPNRNETAPAVVFLVARRPYPAP